MSEIVFQIIEDDTDGGFTARALGHSIVTEADTWEQLRLNVREAVLCHFDKGKARAPQPRPRTADCPNPQRMNDEMRQVRFHGTLNLTTPFSAPFVPSGGRFRFPSGSAGFPTCGFGRLSSRQFCPRKPRTGMSALTVLPCRPQRAMRREPRDLIPRFAGLATRCELRQLALRSPDRGLSQSAAHE